MWFWNKTTFSTKVLKKMFDVARATWCRCSIAHAFVLRFCGIKNRSSHMWLKPKRCLGASWSHCDNTSNRDFFDCCRTNRKMKNKIPPKINSMQKSKNNKILWKQLRTNSSFFEVSSFTSLSGGDHNWRFIAGWKRKLLRYSRLSRLVMKGF